MEVLGAREDYESALERLRNAPRLWLLFDFDGTLAPFQAERDRVRPVPDAAAALEEAARDPRVSIVIVTGRSAESIRRVAPELCRSYEVWASHGLERLRDGRSERAAGIPPETSRAVDEEEGWLAERGWADLVERKPCGLAVHWRGRSPALRGEVERAVRARWAGRGSFAMLDFDGGIELRVPGRTKGDVVRSVLSEGEAGVFFGDDVTDEDAFVEMRGRGLGVLVRDVPRETHADVWIRRGELRSFLRSLSASEAA